MTLFGRMTHRPFPINCIVSDVSLHVPASSLLRDGRSGFPSDGSGFSQDDVQSLQRMRKTLHIAKALLIRLSQLTYLFSAEYETSGFGRQIAPRKETEFAAACICVPALEGRASRGGGKA